MLSFSILDMDKNSSLYRGSNIDMLQVIERDLGMSIDNLYQMKVEIDHRFGANYNAKAILGKSYSCNTLLEYTWCSKREMLKTIGEKCMRRMFEVDKVSYALKGHPDVELAKMVTEVFKKYLCNVELLWGMEYSGKNFDEEAMNAYNHMAKVANYYLDKTAQIAMYMDSLVQQNGKKLVRI